MREKLEWVGFLIGILLWVAISFGIYAGCSQLMAPEVPCDGPPVQCEDQRLGR